MASCLRSHRLAMRCNFTTFGTAVQPANASAPAVRRC